MGDGLGEGAGEGTDGGGYGNVVSMPLCKYCPVPAYTEQARKARVQGTVTLRVLVGADGRGRRVQILKGLDAGLDAKAIEVLRGWRFAPALDVNHRPIPVWVTIETRFQLF